MSETPENKGPEPTVQDPNTPAGPDKTSGQEPKVSTYSEDYVKDLRREAASYRTRASDLERKLETATSELTAIKLQGRENETRSAVSTASLAAGAVYSDVVYGLVTSKDLKLDENGKPDADSLKAALEDIKKEYPALFKSAPNSKSIDAGKGGKQPEGNLNDWIHSALGV